MITLKQLTELAYLKYRSGLLDRDPQPFFELDSRIQDVWRNVVATIIEQSLNLPEEGIDGFRDLANIQDQDILKAEGLTEEDVKQAAKEGAKEAIEEAL